MKIICPTCQQRIKECLICGDEFGDEDGLICFEIRGKHLCNQEDCLFEFLKKRFEQNHIIDETYAEEII